MSVVYLSFAVESPLAGMLFSPSPAPSGGLSPEPAILLPVPVPVWALHLKRQHLFSFRKAFFFSWCDLHMYEWMVCFFVASKGREREKKKRPAISYWKLELKYKNWNCSHLSGSPFTIFSGSNHKTTINETVLVLRHCWYSLHLKATLWRFGQGTKQICKDYHRGYYYFLTDFPVTV